MADDAFFAAFGLAAAFGFDAFLADPPAAPALARLADAFTVRFAEDFFAAALGAAAFGAAFLACDEKKKRAGGRGGLRVASAGKTQRVEKAPQQRVWHTAGIAG